MNTIQNEQGRSGVRRVPKAMSDGHFDALCAIVEDRSGIRLARNRKAGLESRLAHRLRDLGVETYDQYLALLTTGPYQHEEFQALLDRLALRRPALFADASQLDAFEQRVLPRLIEARKASRRLRIWCAGCATGEEAATVGIIVHRSLGVRIGEWSVDIIGTDLSERAIESARSGCFGEQSLGSTPSLVRSRYFAGEHDGAMLHETVRSLLSFERHDPRDAFGVRRLGPFDVIFCRDALRHVGAETARRVVGSFTGVLAPDGRLFLGTGDSIDESDEVFVRDTGANGACFMFRGTGAMRIAA